MRRHLDRLALALLFGLIANPAAAIVTGQAEVVDGDTIAIRGERMNLFAIDAPELAQMCTADGKDWPCGKRASQALADKIAGREVTCRQRDTNRFRVPLVVCNVDEDDINAWMVIEGWALAFRQHALDYVSREYQARSGHRGMWRGEFTAPWEWQQRQQ
ncbi:MAG: thermonuclease family protein [Steroidobacter sp.]